MTTQRWQAAQVRRGRAARMAGPGGSDGRVALSPQLGRPTPSYCPEAVRSAIKNNHAYRPGAAAMAYVFDPDTVHECALACLGKPKPAMFDAFA